MLFNITGALYHRFKLVFFSKTSEDPDKTELIWFGSKLKFADFTLLRMILNICPIVVESTDSVRDLCVILEACFDASACGQIVINLLFHLRRLRQFQWTFDPSSRQRLVSAFNLSRIDFCHALLAGLQACNFCHALLAGLQACKLSLLQSIGLLNAAARFVAALPVSAHVINTIWSFHWLPVAYRIR